MSTAQPFPAIHGRRFRLAAVLALCIGALAALPSSAASAPAVQVQVDPRVELFSILFRLAGAPEYSQGHIASYDKAIDAHFGSFGEHPAVQMARRLYAERGVAFDLVMRLAIHVTDVSALEEKIPFDSRNAQLSHWRAEDARALLVLTRQFVRDTRFEEFFRAQRPLYDLTEARMRQLLAEQVDLAWFERFFGERPAGGLFVIPGLVNGGANYGPKLSRPDGSEDLYAIMGVWLTDEAGQPRFDETIAAFVIHEFNHSFINHVVEKHEQELAEAGEVVFQAVALPMKRQAYGTWKTVIDESLVRAAVVRYLQTHRSADAAAAEVTHQQKEKSFLWMGELSDLLAKYESSRERYPTFASFMPEVSRYFRNLALRVSGMVRESAAGERSSGNPEHEPGLFNGPRRFRESDPAFRPASPDPHRQPQSDDRAHADRAAAAQPDRGAPAVRQQPEPQPDHRPHSLRVATAQPDHRPPAWRSTIIRP